MSYTDPNPPGGKKTSYLVKAVSADPATYTDAEFGAAKSIKLPDAPEKLKAKLQKGGQVKISWKKVKGASAYLVYRANSKNGKYKLLKIIQKKNASSYVDRKNKKNGKTYYKVAVLKNGKYSPMCRAVKAS